MSAVLVDLARTLVADLTIQQTLDHLVARVVEALPVTGAGILMIGADRPDRLSDHFVAATDDIILQVESLQMELGEGPCLDAYHTGRSVMVPDLTRTTAFPRFAEQAVVAGLGAVFSFPLSIDDERLGALELYVDHPADLDPADQAGAQDLADVIAAYLHTVRARTAVEQAVAILEEQASRDPLTGLPNRALLYDRLDQAMRRAQRTGAPLGLLFIDVDGLKAVNDTYGHATGDELLVGVARRVAGVLRPSDTLARLSGDEFVVLCDGLGQPREAEEVAERILAALEDPIRTRAAPLPTTISIGAAFAGAGHGTATDALRRADAAMYVAKDQGGGRVVSADGATNPDNGHWPRRPLGARVPW